MEIALLKDGQLIEGFPELLSVLAMWKETSGYHFPTSLYIFNFSQYSSIPVVPPMSQIVISVSDPSDDTENQETVPQKTDLRDLVPASTNNRFPVSIIIEKYFLL